MANIVTSGFGKLTVNKLPPLSEDDEQINLVAYLEARGLKFTAIPNHTYNPNFSQQNKNKKLGLRKGLPDMLVVLPNIGLIFIEMKRTRGSTTSTEQKDWIAALNTCPGVEARICKGATEAIKFIEELYP
jgi:hypothetical protein